MSKIILRFDRPYPYHDDPARLYFDHNKAGATISMSTWEHGAAGGISKGQAKDLYLALKKWVEEDINLYNQPINTKQELSL